MSDERFSDYIVFVDESGDHSLTSIDTGYPVFVLCFCIMRKDDYSHKIVPAIRQVKFNYFGHDQVILHERDIRKRTGDFHQMPQWDRDSFMGNLSTVIRDSDMTIVAIVINKYGLQEKYKSPEHPYYLALKYGLERVHAYLAHQGQQDRLAHVICESRGRKEDKELELEFLRVCSGNNWGGDLLPFSMVMADKRSNSEGLQLADLTARPIGLSVIRPQQRNQAYDIIRTKFYSGVNGVAEGNGIKVFP